MNRYEFNNILSNPSSPRYLSSTRYPNIPLDINDVYVITQYGDRLDALSNLFYGDPTLWWVISIANPELPNDSLFPPVGYQLRIPTFVNETIRNLEDINK